MAASEPVPLLERKAWQALRRHYAEISGQHLRELAEPAWQAAIQEILGGAVTPRS